MSLHTKRVIGYSFIIWITLTLTALIPLVIVAYGQEHLPAVADATPLPWWQQVEAFQALALKWIAALTAVCAGLATLVSVVIAQYKNLKERMDRVSERADSLQAIAIAATVKQVETNIKTASEIATLQKPL